MLGPHALEARRHRAELGRWAEQAVADYLVAARFVVLGRNLRVGRYELDVVARRSNLIVVVEVRTRGPGSFQHAWESISAAKRRRLLLAVDRLWRERIEAMGSVDRVRIDAAAVRFDGGRTHVEYVEGALSDVALGSPLSEPDLARDRSTRRG